MTTEKIVRAVGEARKASKKRNFTQSFDLAINLRDVDMSKPENRLSEEVVLPKGRGKPVKVAVIAGDELALAAKEHADLVITKEELEELAKDKKKAKKLANDIDFFIAQAELMPTIGRFLGPVLGPRGKMPKPVPPNAPIAAIVERLRRTVRLRTKDKPVIHVAVGSEEMSDEEIAQNVEAVLSHLERKLDKGMGNIKSVYIKTTMGPSVRVEV
ncbi:MAG: 50S ribosomal protein L1 [Euryarchaeota archaeon]|nr:50S ribosomal protein L1 [Euryarchaeota archaeon]